MYEIRGWDMLRDTALQVWVPCVWVLHFWRTFVINILRTAIQEWQTILLHCYVPIPRKDTGLIQTHGHQRKDDYCQVRYWIMLRTLRPCHQRTMTRGALEAFINHEHCAAGSRWSIRLRREKYRGGGGGGGTRSRNSVISQGCPPEWLFFSFFNSISKIKLSHNLHGWYKFFSHYSFSTS